MASGFARIVRQVGYKREFISPNHARIMVPGLPYTAYDAFEYPAVWSVLNIIDSAQSCTAFSNTGDDSGSLLDMNNFFDHHPSFSVSCKIDYYEQLYNKNIVKAPLYIDNWITHMGKTSLVIDSEMKADTFPLAKFRQMQLCVDRTTKRPLPNPDWLKENYDRHCNPGEPIRFAVLEKPSIQSLVTRVSSGRVQYSDTDTNFHMNFSNYLKYCINGIFESKMSDSVPGRPQQPLLVKSAFMWFREECLLGDSLDIEFWNDETKSSTICVDMLKDGTSVCQCILEFYDAEKLKSAL